jgi:predicted RNA polymerase sigma factor
VGRAVALAQTGQPTAGLAALEEIPDHRTNDYQPYWAARGHILRLLNRPEEAQQAFTRAAGLTEDPALRRYLFGRAAEQI